MKNNIDLRNIRIDIEEGNNDTCWIWMLENGEPVEGGAFPLQDFMNAVLEFYNKNY
jgi:hypothetical protein